MQKLLLLSLENKQEINLSVFVLKVDFSYVLVMSNNQNYDMSLAKINMEPSFLKLNLWMEFTHPGAECKDRLTHKFHGRPKVFNNILSHYF